MCRKKKEQQPEPETKLKFNPNAIEVLEHCGYRIHQLDGSWNFILKIDDGNYFSIDEHANLLYMTTDEKKILSDRKFNRIMRRMVKMGVFYEDLDIAVFGEENEPTIDIAGAFTIPALEMADLIQAEI